MISLTPSATISFSTDAFQFTEGNSQSFANSNVVTINRSGDLSSVHSIEVIISSGSPGSAIGGDSASGLTDYENTSFPITVTFDPGETSQTIQIPIYGDTTVESADTIVLALVNPSGGASLGTNPTATLTIQNDDSRGLLDIVFVQDLSGSFGDDIATVRGLIPNFISNILNFEPNAQFAVASFVDKPTSPFGSGGDYVYRTDLPLTSNITDVQTTYDNLVILSGDDTNESQLEALMQTGLRAGEIGFREGSKRLAIIFTDAPYHVAGDGSAASIYAPNNGNDILDGTPPGTGEDYPSIAQVANVLSAAGVGVIPVFAVTSENISAYESLIAELGGVGSVVSLASDSSNITSAVQTALGEVVNISVTADPNLLTTESGGSVTFTVSLTSQPSADVTIPIYSSDITEGVVDVTALTFTPTNFNIGQTVTVTGVDDALVDSNVSYTIFTGKAVSSDLNYNSLDAADVAVVNEDNEVVSKQYYTFTYNYGNGDSYSGYGYAAAGTYVTGQTLSPYPNETGNSGYYTIDSIREEITGSIGYVYVTSYTDQDTTFGRTTNVSSNSYGTGLGSEYGNAYDASGNGIDSYFSIYYEADLIILPPKLSIQATDAVKAEGNSGLTSFTFNVNRVGDLSYSSSVNWRVVGSTTRPAEADDFYGGLYPEGILSFAPNQANATITVEVNGDTYTEPDEFFAVTLFNPVNSTLDTSSIAYNITSSVSGGYGVTTNYYSLAGGGGRFVMDYEMYWIPDQAEIFINGSLAASTGGFVSGSGSLNLDTYNLQSGDMVRVVMTGSDPGTAWDYTVQYDGGAQTLNYIADGLILNDDYIKYNFTYFYGNGDKYSGFVFAPLGTYTVGQLPDYYDNETGTQKGYYVIDSVEYGVAGTNGYVQVTSYTDADTGFGEAISVSSGVYSGLGSEYGYAYNSDGNAFDPYFSKFSEADIIGQEYTFTYFYGNGDNYSGYGFAPLGTYTVGQLPDYYDNETGTQKGYYVINSINSINSVEDGATGTNGYVYITSYTDADTGFGTTTNVSGGLYAYGLGSEYGYAYNSDGNTFDPYFNSYYEADIIGQKYTFTYFYGNGDNYSGYGFAPLGTYTVGQLPDYYDNETGTQKGYYVINSINSINSVEDGATGTNGYVYITSYTDADTGFGETTNIWDGRGYSGLGSEYGYAYNSDGNTFDRYFNSYYEADIIGQQYTFTYFYGNGDNYSGYGFAPLGTYTVGQLPDYYDNETGTQKGYYVINSVEDGATGTKDYVQVTSYTDADTGFGETTSIYSGSGYYGLGSEYGYAFNANPWTGDTYFSRYNEADLPAALKVQVNLLADDGGKPGEVLADNRVGLNHSFFVQIQAGDFRPNAAGVVGLNLDFAWNGSILESINFNPSLDITSNFPYQQGGTLASDGLIDDLSGGSLPEFGTGKAIGVNQLETFALLHFSTQNYGNWWGNYFTTTVNDVSLADDNPYYSLNVETDQPVYVVTPYAKYNFTYTYANGDSYTGYVYAVEGTYTEGQIIAGTTNETGFAGSYTIGSTVETTLDVWYNNRVYVTSYTDADTGFGETTNISKYWWGGNGDYGLGSENGYAYDSNGLSSDPFFGADGSGIHKEADILNQKYTFTYTYGNGDSYSGYGYALAGTYTEGQIVGYYTTQIVGYYPNETESSGTPGHYTINSVEAETTSSSVNNHVYITSYTDNDTFYGETTNVSKHWWGGNGDSGLGSEYGYAYDSNGSAWDGGYFNKYYEADLVKATLSISDNSGNASDSSIKFTTQFPKRINYTESDFVRPNFADTTKYIEIANNGTGILQVVSLQVSDDVLGVTTNFKDLISSEVDYLLINPGASQQIQLTYDPSVAGENFSVANGLLLVTNDPYNPQHAIALQGKSTYDADINYDGKVGIGDLGPLNNAYKNFKEGIYDSTADINGDGDVGLGDLGLLTAQWGSVL